MSTGVRWRACGRKRTYSRAAAQHAAARIRAESSTWPPARPYRCPFCGGHHVGHTPSLAELYRIAREIRGLDHADRGNSTLTMDRR